ncbi:hypothetical protein EUGRSUZ_H01519 [Eucalyptus grandis]|uniref:Uncharacterized protein n=2 Tax=Eucalyptus grandis TaxID=71139 RepID=A0ACC3JNA2_EUCGR|nr:hypothetical protein EUGRSUZ_H01519 [Eucalyptus grandis]
MNANQRLKPSHQGGGGGGSCADSPEPGILNERVLLLVFESIQWDLRVLCLVSSVNRKLRAIAKRLLWRELCAYRAPRMVATLTAGGARIGGGWPAVAKLMFFCCGAEPSRNFRMGQQLPGHFASTSRFSKTSGRSFLPRRCRGDVLYVSDPCEHEMKKAGHQDDLGVYRGVFKEFSGSRTRACLIGRRVGLEDRACPYCGARVWSMTTARLVPRSAARRLGSRNGRLEYFVCVNGHLHGTCWLAPLSSEEEEEDDGGGGGGGEFEDDYDDDEDGGDDDKEGGRSGQDAVNEGDDRAATDGSTSSTGEEIIGEWGPAE